MERNPTGNLINRIRVSAGELVKWGPFSRFLEMLVYTVRRLVFSEPVSDGKRRVFLVLLRLLKRQTAGILSFGDLSLNRIKCSHKGNKLS
jgi:hypothetical protein